jgi:nucleotide-binding universal stress UspA family protein
MYAKILAPLDGSPGAEASLPHARSLVSRLKAELILLRVDEPIPNLPSNRYPAEIESAAKTYLRHVAEPMQVKNLRVRTVVEYGDPSDRIVRYAAANRVDLIVMATKAKGLSHSLLGRGTVQRVFESCTTAVLLVHGE